MSTLPRRWDGPEVLDPLLRRSQANVDSRGVIARITTALAEGLSAGEVIPALFPGEPRFGSPEEARLFYANVLGLWELLSAGTDPESLLASSESSEPRTPPPPEAPPPELPTRGLIDGPELPEDWVEYAWRALDGEPERDRRRRADRCENAQSELAQWPTLAEGLSDDARDRLTRFCFELWGLFDLAVGDRLGFVTIEALLQSRASEASARQPAVALHVARSLDEWEASDETPTPEDRGALEVAAGQLVVALSEAILEGPPYAE